MALPLLAVRVYAATRSLLEAGSLLEVKILQTMGRMQLQKAGEEVAHEVEHVLHATFGMLADTGRPNAMAWDVVLSAVIIGLWTALAEADQGRCYVARCCHG
jgi:hypothetical protein